MFNDFFGIDIVAFGKAFGVYAAFTLIWIFVWYRTFRFTAKFIKNCIEEVKDKEIERMTNEKNYLHRRLYGDDLLTSKPKGEE